MNSNLSARVGKGSSDTHYSDAGRVGLNKFLKLNSKVWQESLEFFNHIPRQGQELAGTLGQLVVTGHGDCTLDELDCASFQEYTPVTTASN
jgi:hypothetical protein